MAITLTERINALQKNGVTKVAVGPKNGNNFLYVGPVDDNTLNKIDEDYNKYLEKVKGSIAEFERTELKYLMNTTALIDSYPKRKDESDEVNAKNAMLLAMHRISSASARYDNWVDYVKHYKKPSQRKVYDEYRRITDDGVVILIAGTELGSCWTEDDYAKQQLKKS